MALIKPKAEALRTTPILLPARLDLALPPTFQLVGRLPSTRM